MIIREHRAFKHAVSDPAIGKVTGVHELDASPFVHGLKRPVFVVSCYSDRKRQLCLEHPKFILLYQNSYLLSFVHNAGLGWLYHTHFDPVEIEPFGFGLAKKFIAEQLNRIKSSTISRVLFMEAVLSHEAAWRVAVDAARTDARLRESSKRCTQIAADLMLYHEVGHLAIADTRYDQYVSNRVNEYIDSCQLSLEAENLSLHIFEEEAKADLFGINACIARYSTTMTQSHLVEYLRFAIRSIVAMNVQYAAASDIHRVNVDKDYPADSVGMSMLMWAHREAVMLAYLDTFRFEEQAVFCNEDDDFLHLPPADELLLMLSDVTAPVERVDENTRRVLQSIDIGFETGQNFDSVINGFRSSWMLYGTESPKDQT